VPSDPAAAFNVTGLSADKYYQYMAIVDKEKLSDSEEDFKWPDSLLFNSFIWLQVRAWAICAVGARVREGAAKEAKK
jgi:hypothetical protein